METRTLEVTAMQTPGIEAIRHIHIGERIESDTRPQHYRTVGLVAFYQWLETDETEVYELRGHDGTPFLAITGAPAPLAIPAWCESTLQGRNHLIAWCERRGLTPPEPSSAACWDCERTPCICRDIFPFARERTPDGKIYDHLGGLLHDPAMDSEPASDPNTCRNCGDADLIAACCDECNCYPCSCDVTCTACGAYPCHCETEESLHIIDDRTARKIASDWHNGDGSALYAFLSTGAILPTCKGEIRSELAESLQRQYPDHDVHDLAALLCYVMTHGERDPIADWSERTRIW